MKILFRRHTRIGETVHDQGTIAELPESIARQMISTGRADLVTEPPQPKRPEPKLPEPTEGVEYRDTSLRDFFRKG